MPNGFVGSRDRWIELERDLTALDSAVTNLASAHRLVVEKNVHSWPSRRLRWTSEGLERLVEIALDGEREPFTYTVRSYAWKDDERRRRSRIEVVETGLSSGQLNADSIRHLERAIRIAGSWSVADLDRETSITP